VIGATLARTRAANSWRNRRSPTSSSIVAASMISATASCCRGSTTRLKLSAKSSGSSPIASDDN